ncbi:tetratricopeptide repeat protein [Haloferula rosea]|uniref:Tetratricopeptide repeat protein n=1 Tax=Haloferula rosea TaxID=490093 RepID=A0A934VGP5_9BACT|nr:tetratricopeptide repeat protein [Haloferula rosea]MBK1828257.1 tetratricopeptide repeat protein [Haloferula rosea]
MRLPLFAACLWAVGGVVSAPAQLAPRPAAQPAPNFDPSDVYFQGWLLSKDADKLAEKGKATEALEKYRRAQQLFDTIARSFPEWKKEMVEGRRTKTVNAIASVAPEALKEKEADARVVAELEGGARTGAGPDGNQPNRLDTGIPAAPIPSTRPIETLESRRIADLEKQVTALQDQIKRGTGGNADPTTTERQRDLAISELQKTRAELDRLRRSSAQVPMQRELDALSRRINSIEGEKAAMARALDASRGETKQAKAQIDALQVERGRLLQQVKQLEQQVADAKGNLEIERKAANEVVAGQLNQIKELQSSLTKKDKELARANKHIRSLESALQEVRDSLDEVEEERDELLRERDQMAALLKLNEAGQLQEVIDQNMALDRELRETKDRYEALQEDSDASKDDLLEALRDLAISKLRIQEYRRENTEQQERLDQLQARLEREAMMLDSSDVDPAEAAVLRGIINKQLQIQKKRSQARELLMEALGEKASQDEDIRTAMNIFQGAELNLSPEELSVIDGQEVDGVIVSPFARPRSEVERSEAGLRSELKPYIKAGVRSFREGRPQASREIFEMVIERNPGDTMTMCMLGLVEYKLENPVAAADMFQQVTELDPRNPYAHRMLGHTLTKIGEFEPAIKSLERAVEYAPTNAEGHLLLANALFRYGNLEAAEESFRTSLSCDPTSAEAHYNLAVLYNRQGKRKNALEHYAKALELGAAPNLDLEKSLGKLD